MTKVRIAAGAEYDLVSPEDLNGFRAELGERFRALSQEQLRGIKIERTPQASVRASATGPLLLPGAQGGGSQLVLGPESGYVWRVGRVVVQSNGTDSAGSQNPTPSQPAVPATGVAQQNANAYPVSVAIAANGATITAVTVNGVQVGSGAGTYTVPAGGSISIAYSVATPTWVWSNLAVFYQPGAPVSLYISSDGSTSNRGFIDSTLQVGAAYYPSSRGLFLMPGEQLVASVGATNGNSYTISGQVVIVPAEMMGKLV
jgi:hypothetical protein